jgi:hypothetical protein
MAVPQRLPPERVVVDGAGLVAAGIASLLRAAGVGRVEAGIWAADAADAELRGAGAGAPDLVVLVASGLVDPRAGEPWRRRGVPQLPVVIGSARVVVGPWMTGDPGSPCLWCLRLLRGGANTAVTEEPDAPLTAMAAGMAALVAQAGLRGGVPGGVSVEVAGSLGGRAAWPRVEHRRWTTHVECPNHDRDAAVVRRTRGPDPWHTGRPLARNVVQAVRIMR